MEPYVFLFIASPLIVGLAQHALLSYVYQLPDGLGRLDPLFLLLRLGWLMLLLTPCLALVRETYLGYHAPETIVLLGVLVLLALLVFQASRYVLFVYLPATNKAGVVLLGAAGTLLLTAWTVPTSTAGAATTLLTSGTPLPFVATVLFLVLFFGTWVQRMARTRARDLYQSKPIATRPN